MMTNVQLKYGKGTIEFDVPEDRLLGVIEPKPMPPIADKQAALEKAMQNCFGPPMEDIVKKDSRVLVLTVDITRPSPIPLLPSLLGRLDKLGARTDVMIGLGMHRKMTEPEIKQHMNMTDVLQNDPNGPMWSGGTTSFDTPIEVDERVMDYDLRMAVGFVEPSYLLGYTGGRKIVMPGVASARAIARNHFLILKPGRKLGVLNGNPLSDDALEFARAVGLHWLIDVTLNPDDSYAAIHCGDMVKANEAACSDCAKIYEHKLTEKADIVVVGCGGYPYDFDLVQTKKGIVPAMECVKPGGVIILAGECPDGWGAEGFVSRPALENEKPADILASLYSQFESGDCPWDTVPCSSRYLFSRAVEELKCQVIAVTGINDDLSKTFVDTAASVNDALQMAEDRVGTDAGVTVIPDGRRLIPLE